MALKKRSADDAWLKFFDDEMHSLIGLWSESTDSGDLDMAHKAALDMVRTQPGNAISWRCLGRVLELAGRKADAEAVWSHIVTGTPGR